MPVLLAESERKLQRVVDQFHSVCSRRKLRVKVGKSKMIVLERKEVERVDLESIQGECTSTLIPRLMHELRCWKTMR